VPRLRHSRLRLWCRRKRALPSVRADEPPSTIWSVAWAGPSGRMAGRRRGWPPQRPRILAPSVARDCARHLVGPEGAW